MAAQLLPQQPHGSARIGDPAKLATVTQHWTRAITNHADTYWPKMLDIARSFNIARIKKCCQIMGRLEGNLTAAQVLYPLMQCTDVFFLKADICQLGVDQRKVNMLAREYADRKGLRPPVILSHHMLMGLGQGEEKMSKSNPDSAIFMEDEAHVVKRKIKKVSTVLYQEFHTANSFSFSHPLPLLYLFLSLPVRMTARCTGVLPGRRDARQPRAGLDEAHRLRQR